jgi:hypothetical protein
MSQWGKSDVASNSVIWAPTSVKLAPTRTNANNLFGNTTANSFIGGTTTGMFAVDANEIAAEGGKTAHTGWVLRTVGQGGRAGRVQTEVLVAGGITADAEDVVYPDYTLRIVTQPVSSEEAADSAITFTVTGASTPAGASLTYKWQESANGNVYVNLTDTGDYSNTSTATLSIANNSPVDGYYYRVQVGATGAANVVSTAVTANVAA